LVEPIATPCMIGMDLPRTFSIIIKHRTGPVHVYAQTSVGRKRNFFTKTGFREEKQRPGKDKR